MQTELSLEFTQDISNSDFNKFQACNQAPKSWIYKRMFYDFKTKFLKEHTLHDGYDLQKITKTCWTCGGSGTHWTEDICWSCDGTGIYENVNVALSRYVLNGNVFHVPVGRIYQGTVSVNGKINICIRETINGLIKHEPTIKKPEYELLVLFYKYDRDRFWALIQRLYSQSTTYQKNKWNKLVRYSKNVLHNIAIWLGVKYEPDPREEIDDLPF